MTPTDPRPNLDGPPPAAPGMVRRSPDAAMAPTMGAPAPVGPATLPQSVIEHAMLAEQALQSLAQVAPMLTPAVAQMIEQLRMAVAAQLQGGQQPQLMMGGPAMAGAAPQPAGPGAAMPMMA